MTLLIIAIMVIEFVAGILIGAYGHKYIASRAKVAGITPPAKLP